MTEQDRQRSTIAFRCPHCGNLCAFPSDCAGRRARCMKCGQRFIIPDRDDAVPDKVSRRHQEPMGGFFSSLFVRTWGVFVHGQSITMLFFLIFLVVVRHFLDGTDWSIQLPGFTLHLPIGWIVIFLTWGLQAWFYMEVIGTTFLDEDELLESELGGGLDFLWTVIKSIYLYICAFLVSVMPFVLLANGLRIIGLDWKWLLYPLPWLGLLTLPLVLLILSTGQELYQVFRLDQIVVPIFRAFGPYVVVVLLVLLAVAVEWLTKTKGRLDEPSAGTVWLHLAGNIAAALLNVFAMRAIGLFGRHYECYLPWLRE
ncbi:MAG: hypothetical protein JW828_05515 [Sedimentisphaerales bacterium]|nr:hypothetical protein [Sedimentisphaerales bacterium]